MATTAKSAKCNNGKCTNKTKTVAATVRSTVTREVSIPEDYEPIGMWGYFGYEFLFSIPLIGWILCISFALMAHNHNLRNFARSQFCVLIIQVALFCVLAFSGILNAMIEPLM